MVTPALETGNLAGTARAPKADLTQPYLLHFFLTRRSI
jgi:hypothetical protein